MSTPRILSTLLCATALAMAPAAARADVVVITSARSPLTSLSAEQVTSVFLGKSGAQPDGSRLTAVNQPEGNATRDEFYARIAGKSPTQVKAYWSKMIFSGRGQPPQEVQDDAAVRRMVAEHPGTIGYVDRAALDGTVRPVDVVGRP